MYKLYNIPFLSVYIGQVYLFPFFFFFLSFTSLVFSIFLLPSYTMSLFFLVRLWRTLATLEQLDGKITIAGRHVRRETKKKIFLFILWRPLEHSFRTFSVQRKIHVILLRIDREIKRDRWTSRSLWLWLWLGLRCLPFCNDLVGEMRWEETEEEKKKWFDGY